MRFGRSQCAKPGWQFTVLAWLCLCVPSIASGNEDAQSKTTPWRWGLYAGRYTDTRFVEIVRGQTDFKKSTVGAVMVSRKVAATTPYAEWDVELGLARHWGLQHHYEVNAALMLRVVPWPHAENWRLSAGLGIGPSLATATPRIERARGGRTSRRLLFMPFEVTLGPSSGRSAIFARVHHRSGGFDVASRGRGSNFVAVGGRLTW